MPHSRAPSPRHTHALRYFKALPHKLAVLCEAVHNMRLPPEEATEAEAQARVEEVEEEVEARHGLLVTQA
jgi:hypothetical protein